MRRGTFCWLALLLPANFGDDSTNSVSNNEGVSRSGGLESFRIAAIGCRRAKSRTNNEASILRKKGRSPSFMSSATRAWKRGIIEAKVHRWPSLLRRCAFSVFASAYTVLSFEWAIRSNSSTFITWPIRTVPSAFRPSLCVLSVESCSSRWPGMPKTDWAVCWRTQPRILLHPKHWQICPLSSIVLIYGTQRCPAEEKLPSHISSQDSHKSSSTQWAVRLAQQLLK